MTSPQPPTGDARLRQYQALLDVAEAITRHDDPADLFRDLARRLRRVVTVDFITVLLHEEGPDGAVMRRHLLEPADADHTYRGPEITPMASPGGVVWETQRPLIVPDYEAEPRFPLMAEHWRRIGMRSGCYLPLTVGGRRLGALNFAAAAPRDTGPDDLAFLCQVARLVAVAVDNGLHAVQAACYQRKLAEERDRLRLLLDVNNAVVTHLDLRELYRAVAEGLRRVLRQDYLSLALYDEARHGWRLHALEFPSGKGHLREELDAPFEGAPASAAYLSRRPAVFTRADLERLNSEVARRLLADGVSWMCAVPLLSRGRVLGTVNAGRLDGSAFVPAEVELLAQAAGQIALAVDNALAFREITVLKEKLAQEKSYLEDEIRTEGTFSEIVGDSVALRKVLRQVEIVAPTPTTVLIQGETGTGKELIARAIHRLSARRERTFVKLNCAAIPTGLLESELFGHEKGAFTGAIARKVGRFELADGGTLFLDEVGDIAPELQPKLLRVLQEQELERLGGTKTIKVDVRLVAATNLDLARMVAERRYRSDLFYRLNVFPLTLPPLRERPEDVPQLARYFVEQHARRLNRPVRTIPEKALTLLTRYPWPGNVRELENYIERAVLLSPGPELRVSAEDLKASDTPPAGEARTLADAEREAIVKALEEARWVLGGPAGAAARLGMKRTTLQSKMKKLGIERAGGGA
jgi:formate hydrogenlyase transcriptional activator